MRSRLYSPRLVRWVVALLPGFLAVAFLQTLRSQSIPNPTLLVLSKRNRTLSMIDPTTFSVVAAVPVGPDPHEVVATPDGRFAYVSDYGFGAFHTLSVVDLVAHRALPVVDLGALAGPHGLSNVGGEIWFTAEAAKAIGRYNPATGKVDFILGTGQDRTHMLYVTPDEKRVYTTNVNAGTVSILDQVLAPAGAPPPGFTPPPGFQPHASQPTMLPQWRETVVSVGRGDEGFDLSPDGRELWTANAQDGTISIMDTSAMAVVATLDLGLESANRLKFTPDGRYVLVSRIRSGNLTVVDTHSRTIARLIPVGHGAEGILIQPDGARAYIACSPDDSVAVLDLKTFQVVARIDAGPDPDGMAWAVRR